MLYTVEPRELDHQNLAIEEQQRTACKILRRSRHIPLDREVGEKSDYFRTSHFSRVSLAVEKNEASNPVDVCLLGANAVVLETDALTHLVEKRNGSGRRCHHGRREGPVDANRIHAASI